MKNKTKSSSAAGWSWGIMFAVVVSLMIGWVLNIIAIVQSDFTLTGMFVARVIGVFVAPVGGILGWF